MTELDAQEKESLSMFEKGHRLNQLVALPGYKDLLDIFEGIADTYEARLINLPSGESDQLLRDLHIEAKVARAILTIVDLQVQRTIEMGRQAINQATSPQYNNL